MIFFVYLTGLLRFALAASGYVCNPRATLTSTTPRLQARSERRGAQGRIYMPEDGILDYRHSLTIYYSKTDSPAQPPHPPDTTPGTHPYTP